MGISLQRALPAGFIAFCPNSCASPPEADANHEAPERHFTRKIRWNALRNFFASTSHACGNVMHVSNVMHVTCVCQCQVYDSSNPREPRTFGPRPLAPHAFAMLRGNHAVGQSWDKGKEESRSARDASSQLSQLWQEKAQRVQK